LNHSPEAGRVNIVRPNVYAFDVKPPQNQATLLQSDFRHDHDRAGRGLDPGRRNRALGLLTDDINDHAAPRIYATCVGFSIARVRIAARVDAISRTLLARPGGKNPRLYSGHGSG
jgi:hypothetical protein